MKLEAVSGIMLTLLLTSMLTLAFNIEPVSAGEYPAIYIEPATTVNPDLTPGKNFTVSIYTDCIGGPKDILKIGDITGYQFTLYYNPNVLHGGIEIDDADTWTGDGDKKTFYTTEKPVPESERVYVNETLMTRDVDYIIDYKIGNITFTLQPTDIWTGNGTDHIFYTTGKPIVPDSEKVYVNQTLMTRFEDYYITYDEGRILFGTKKHPKPPGVGAEIKAIYLYPYPPGLGAEIKATYLYNGVVNGDLITKEEHPTHNYVDAMDVCSAVFSAGTFDNTEGKLLLTVGYFREEEWTAGPGTLANVTFTVVGKGTSSITIGPETKLIGWDYLKWEKYDIINAETEPTHIQHGYFDNVKPIPATVDANPNTLNLKSRSEWITTYLELPEGYNVSDIDIYSIKLNNTFPVSLLVNPPVPVPTEIGDYDNDTIPDLMVKFNRTEVASWIYDDLGIQYGNVTLTIAGELFDGTQFEGTDTIKVLFPGDADDDGDVDCNDLYVLSHCHGMSIENLSYNPLADFNEDGYINSEDLYILSGNYGKTAV